MESLHRSQFRLLTPPWLMTHQLSAKSITKQSTKQVVRESCLLPALTLAQPQSPQRETQQRRKRCFENTCLCCYMFYRCWAIHGIGNRMTNHQRLFQKDQQFDSMFSWVFNLEYETLTWTHREGWNQDGHGAKENSECSASSLSAEQLRDRKQVIHPPALQIVLCKITPYSLWLRRGWNKIVPITILTWCRKL